MYNNQTQQSIQPQQSMAASSTSDNSNPALARHNARKGTELLKSFISNLKDGTSSRYIPTGFIELDRELDGGLYPGLYILGAVSSLGKTTLLLQMADQIAAQGTDVLYFSLEMGATELISKSISRLTFQLCDGYTQMAKTARGITIRSRYASYTSDEKKLIQNAVNEYRSHANHLFIYEGIGNIGVTQIQTAVKEHMHLTGHTPVVLIDYLQILAPANIFASDKQNTDKSVLELKRLSRDYNTPVIAISSFNRDNYTTEVNMTAFKESGAIEYGSDVLLALQPQGMQAGYTKTEQRENAELVKQCKRSLDRKVEAVLLKNRNGRTGGKIGFTYYAMFNCFKEDGDEGFLPVPDEESTPFDSLDEEEDNLTF